MDARAAKLALARQKLKDHQVKKNIQKDDKLKSHSLQQSVGTSENCSADTERENTTDFKQKELESQAPECKLFEQDSKVSNSDVHVTEILISSKRILEMQVNELRSRLFDLEHNYSLAIEANKDSKQIITNLENTLKDINERNQVILSEMLSKDKILEELNKLKETLEHENNNLSEQLDFTKAILVEKDTENASLRNQLSSCQNQLDAMQLQIQQLTNGYPSNLTQDISHEENKELTQKIFNLEQQVKQMQKEKEQTNVNYELYVRELNEQLKTVLSKNEQLTHELANQINRENNLVEQIGDMEIRLQNYRAHSVTYEQSENIKAGDIKELQQKYEDSQEKIKELCLKYDEIKKQCIEKDIKIKELSQVNVSEFNSDNISMTKLNADITSDKVALQLTTEQNKKLKKDLQELQEDFIKMTKDKLELTEKLTAEKYLNKELTMKLADINESAKDMKTKLMAKDEEMIRLQASYREVEKKIDLLSELPRESQEIHKQEYEEINEHENCAHDVTHLCEHDSLLGNIHEEKKLSIAKEDAMLKLQARFFKIMEEVADLSDEKHRLEHIILQLQNETDTICEYVALYQQQRSLLKKRDEERGAQIKIFQTECERLKRQIEELSGILIRFAEDKELSSYFQLESRYIDKQKILTLITELKSNSLIDPKKHNLELNNFYPCNCCSGKLIDL